MRFLLRAALSLLAIAALCAAALAFVAQQRLAPVEPDPEKAESLAFTVARGASLGPVAKQLEAAGAIHDSQAFKFLARYRGLETKLRAGEYEISKGWSADRILEHLTSGQVRSYPVVLPEGLRIREIAQRLEAAGLVDAAAFEAVATDADFARSLGIEAENLEGYLFPETYRLPRGLSAEDVARIMVEHFNRVWDRDIAARAAALPDDVKLTRHELVTFASIVEKETGAAEERPRIASVFWNRMRRGMRLETDPTVIYGIANFDGNLRRRHLEDESNPYNTYRIRGLPPGPIANPGAAALRAVVDPDSTEFLFFVSRGDGTHKFSKTYREHDRAVDEFQRRRRRK